MRLVEVEPERTMAGFDSRGMRLLSLALAPRAAD
jgi:hypothetical protein